MYGLEHLSKYMTAILPFVVLGFHFTDKWFLSKGKLWQVYVLTICGSLCTVVYNCAIWTMLQSDHQTQADGLSVFVFSVNSTWTIAMAVKGIVRLMRESPTKRLPSIPMSVVAKPAKFDDKNNVGP